MPTDLIQPSPTDADPEAVARLNHSAQRAINVAALVLPLVFTYLSFREVPVNDVLKALSDAPVASILWKCVLAVYFLLWVLGTRTDAADQAIVYRYAPNKGHLSSSTIGVIAALFAFGAILLYSRNFGEFVLALAAFHVIDWLSWKYLVRRVIRPIVTASRIIYAQQGDVIGAEKLAIMETRICGRWKWWRNSVGGSVVALLGAIALFKQDERLLAGFDSVISWDLLQVLAMAVYVAIMEVWIWKERLRAKISVELLDNIGERYVLRAVAK